MNPAHAPDVWGKASVNYLFTGGINSTGSIQTDFDVNAANDLYVGDDATVMGNAAIGGTPGAGYKLKDFGNGLFATNVGIDGMLRVNEKVTNDGKYYFN